MRYSASEKFEIIELVEQSSLSIRRTLAPIGIPRSTFYDWYSRYQEGGVEALEDGKPRPQRVWNKIPDEIGTAIVNLALEEPDLSPRELAVNFTDTKGSFVSEATVYRLLKDHGLITSPAFILMKAADRFANPTTAPNQLWQTDFTYLKVIGWGSFAARQRLPAIYQFRQFAVAGGVLSYGFSFTDLYRQVGLYAAKVLGGTKPADLPVQHVTKFELVINVKTAKALGIHISDNLLSLADEVIE